MKKQLIKQTCLVLFAVATCFTVGAKDLFPDGTVIPKWFKEVKKPNIKKQGPIYRITDYGAVNDSTVLQTKVLQSIIDQASQTGGVVYIPKGTFLSGALFFKPNTHLYLEKEAVLKGSDEIKDYPLIPSRMEGQNLDYYAALINVYGVNGFTLSGEGTINGNGRKYWEAFWKRREENANCTNLEVSRPRLVFIRDSKDVTLHGVKLINSGFWTTHLYKCENVKLLNLYIFSPVTPVKAPSTDAVDIDICTNVLIKNCYMSVNDDAVALKGGKGPWADQDPNNGANFNIIIEDCTYGYCHGALTFGSESIHDRNIVLRRCTIDKADRLLWLKMRPDTPQKYEFVLVEDIKGYAGNIVYIRPWTQFFDLKGRKDIPLSYSDNVTMRNIDMECKTLFNVGNSDQYKLTNFTFENFKIEASKGEINQQLIENFKLRNVKVNGEEIK